MTARAQLILLAVLASIAASGCVESSREEATGKAAIRAVNAIVTAPDVAFRIEQRTLGNIGYGSSTQAQRYDDLSYTFNFDVTIPGETNARRLASRFLDVVRDTDYQFVLAGPSVDDAEIILWEQPERAWDGSETVFELNFANLNNSTGPVDFYVAADGVAPAAGSEAATVANGEREGPVEFPEGDYVVTITPAGDPQTILFQSPVRNYQPASTDTLMLLDADPSRTGALGVRLVTAAGDSIEYGDPRFPALGRVLHAAVGIGNVDLAADDDFANLGAADLAFGELSADTPLSSGTNSYTFTDAGNAGAVIAEADEAITLGFFETLVLVGPESDPDVVNYVGIRRGFSTSGRVGFVNLDSGRDTIDVYLLPAGTAVDGAVPSSAFLAFTQSTGFGAVEAREYELTVTESADQEAILAGPEPVTVANGDVVEIFVLETADPNVLSIEVVRNAP